MGQHTFTYSLLPHTGNWRESTVSAAYALNDPIIVINGTKEGAKKQYQLCKTDRDNVVIETIKQAEDGNGIIIRLYENQRKRGDVTLTTGFDIKSVVVSNLIEDDIEQIDFEGRNIILPFKPYEIITLRIIPAN